MEPDFTSPRALVDRANFHINEFERALGVFIAEKPYTHTVNKNPAKSDSFDHKIRVTRDAPVLLSVLTFEIVNALRSALDHAVFDATAMVGGDPKPKYTKFPFGKTLEGLKTDFVRKKSEIPVDLKEFLLDFQPYEGGNRTLWGLNEFRNGKIHRTLAVVALQSSGIAIGFGQGGGFIRSAYFDRIGSEWDPAKKELTYMTAGTIDAHNMKIDISIDVTFSEITPYEGKSALAFLRQASGEVASVVSAIEAEASRILRERSV